VLEINYEPKGISIKEMGTIEIKLKLKMDFNKNKEFAKRVSLIIILKTFQY
jgi:hypothetical protein